jgi:hypothetical protein
MKILITENRRIKLIQNYIMSTFPMVDSVDVTLEKKTLGSGPNKFGEEGIIDVNLITVNFDDSEMEYSPTMTIRKIMRQVDSIFGLDLVEYGSYWDFDYRIIN